MPSGSEHRRATREFLGYDVPEVHRFMDLFSSSIPGTRHRLVGHDLAAARFVQECWGDEGFRVFVCHVLQDARILSVKR